MLKEQVFLIKTNQITVLALHPKKKNGVKYYRNNTENTYIMLCILLHCSCTVTI